MTTPTLLEISDGRIGHRQIGSGPDIVFVHGWPLHREIWRDVAAALPGFTCHLIDLPGAGESVMDAGVALDFDALVRGLGEAIDALGLDRYAVIANDSGGMIARHLVADRPDEVTALVLTGTEIPHDRPWLIRLFLALSRLPMAAAVFRLSLGNRLLRSTPMVLGGAFVDRASIGGDFARLFLDRLVNDRALLDRQIEVLRSYRWSDVDALADLHRRITAPTLLLWGPDDPVFPPSNARSMVEQFAGHAEFDTLERGRLFAFAEFPDAFAQKVGPFLHASVSA